MELLSVRLKAVLRAMLFILIITAAWLVMRANIIFTAISLITVAAQLILLLIEDRLSRAG